MRYIIARLATYTAKSCKSSFLLAIYNWLQERSEQHVLYLGNKRGQENCEIQNKLVYRRIIFFFGGNVILSDVKKNKKSL